MSDTTQGIFEPGAPFGEPECALAQAGEAPTPEDTERTCPHCGKLILAPRRSYEIDPAAVCKYGAHTGHRSTY